jgi:hypothetical protein
VPEEVSVLAMNAIIVDPHRNSKQSEIIVDSKHCDREILLQENELAGKWVRRAERIFILSGRWDRHHQALA